MSTRPLLIGLLTTGVLVACRSNAPTSSTATATPTSTPTSTSTSTPTSTSTSTPTSTPTSTASARASASASASGAMAMMAPDAAAPAPEGMLLVPGGTFTMGSDSGGEGDEHPAHAVTIKPFWLDRTEVTQRAYEACVAASACRAADPGALATQNGAFRGPSHPVVGVSWSDAEKYCAWKGLRLPREAEFERAVRGDDGRRYPWGNDAPTHERTVFEAASPEDVGTHPAGRGPYGHDDLAGNVWEWLADDYDPLAYTRPGAPEGKPGTCEEIEAAETKLRAESKQGFTGSNPIPTECDKNIRGGAYNYPGAGLRSTNRIHHPPSFRLKMTGFRCAKDG